MKKKSKEDGLVESLRKAVLADASCPGDVEKLGLPKNHIKDVLNIMAPMFAAKKEQAKEGEKLTELIIDAKSCNEGCCVNISLHRLDKKDIMAQDVVTGVQMFSEAIQKNSPPNQAFRKMSGAGRSMANVPDTGAH